MRDREPNKVSNKECEIKNARKMPDKNVRRMSEYMAQWDFSKKVMILTGVFMSFSLVGYWVCDAAFN
jgi:hypothetical protein